MGNLMMTVRWTGLRDFFSCQLLCLYSLKQEMSISDLQDAVWSNWRPGQASSQIGQARWYSDTVCCFSSSVGCIGSSGRILPRGIKEATDALLLSTCWCIVGKCWKLQSLWGGRRASDDLWGSGGESFWTKWTNLSLFCSSWWEPKLKNRGATWRPVQQRGWGRGRGMASWHRKHCTALHSTAQQLRLSYPGLPWSWDQAECSIARLLQPSYFYAGGWTACSNQECIFTR